jgi:hypothetical protein
MAWDFAAEIHALANYDADDGSTTGTSGELLTLHANQWLTDGAKEVIHILPPKLKQKCTTATGVGTDFKVDLDGLGEVLYVTRENADAGYLAPCREIPSMYGGMATDSSNIMHYATATDPVYWIDGDNSGAATLYVKPTPTTNQPAIVHHIAYPTVVGTNTSIANFPDEAEYLVVLYAAIKACEYQMNVQFSKLPSDLSDLTISAVAPVVPEGPSISYSNGSLTDDIAVAQDAINSAQDAVSTAQDPIIGGAQDAISTAQDAISVAQDAITVGPTDAAGITDIVAPSNATADSGSAYTKPGVAGSASSVTDVTALDSENTIDDFDGNSIEYDQWFATLAHLIEDEEDTELAEAQMDKIKTYIDAFKAEVDSAKAAMAATIKDAELATQVSIRNAELDVSTNNTSMQTLAQASIANASNDVSASIAKMNQSTAAATAKMRESTSAATSKMSQSTSAAIQKMVQSTGAATQKMSQSTGAAIAKMTQSTTAATQKMIQSTNVSLQNAAKTLEAAIQNYGAKIQKFQNEIQLYGVKVNDEINEYQQNLANYQAKIKRYTVDYGWYQNQRNQLKEDYHTGIQLLVNKGLPKQQDKREGAR